MTFEEEYEDVLQNIEMSIIQVYRQHPELVDWEALGAIESMIQAYTAEARGIPVSPRTLIGLSGEVAESVRATCEWRLGRRALVTEDGEKIEPSAKTLDEIIACLKRIRKSIRHWGKRGGRQGYLVFVAEFLP